MIIACPACATRYEVPESSIGPKGRTVRCAKCRHSWFEDGGGEEGIERAEEEHFGATPGHQRAAAMVAAVDETDSASPVAEAANVAQWDADPAFASSEEELAEEDHAAAEFQGDPPVRRRGSRLRLWTWAAVLFAILAGSAIAAASYWGVPDWVPVKRPAFAGSQDGLTLDFPAERQERRQLPNGTEFFGASGTITNVDSKAQPVPPILIVLRDGRDRIVYSWEVTPPKRRLAPGESVTVNEAITDVPRSARVAEIGWKPV